MRLYLRILSGLQIGDEVTLAPPGGVIGRGDGSTLCIRDASVSRTHLELRFSSGAWWVHNLSTRSATIVDGQAVAEHAQPLGREGTLQVGNIAMEYRAEAESPQAAQQEPSLGQSPPTMINIRPQLSAIQHAVKTQLHPLRPPEPPPSQAPATLILRRSEPSSPSGPPPTLSQSPVPPPIPVAAKAPTPVPETRPDDAVLRAEIERWRNEAQQQKQKASQLERLLAEQRQQTEALRQSCEVLQAEVARLTAELAKAPPQSGPAEHRAVPGALPEQALALLSPFSESLEQACDALRDGDAARARNLIRDASFGLADLRDLFETAA